MDLKSLMIYGIVFLVVVSFVLLFLLLLLSGASVLGAALCTGFTAVTFLILTLIYIFDEIF